VVTRERIYIETMQQVLQSTSKIMMDYRGSGNLLYLPLDKLMQGAGAPAAEAAARPAPAETPAETGPRSRDTLRNRERGER
jgi:membrane protease subunit HflK